MKEPAYNISIPKDKIPEMPVVTFSGEITVVDTEEKALEALESLKDIKILGFDTETKPSFQKGKFNKPALMQISTENHCYLFRLNKIGIPKGLASILQDNSVVKVGLSVHDDFHVLHRLTDIEPKGFIDLQKFVAQYKITDISLQKIYAILFSRRISKGQRLTNWEADNLTPQQQTYAAIDAWACLEIYHFLTNGHFNPDESPYKQYIPADEPVIE